MRSKMLGFVAVLLLAAAPAFAGGGERGDVELGVYGGWDWLDDYKPLYPKNGPIFGARLGYFISDHWSVEASGQYLKTKTDSAVTNFDVKLLSGRLNLLYNFAPGSKIR